MKDKESRREFIKRIGRYALFTGIIVGGCGILIRNHGKNKTIEKCKTCSLKSGCFLINKPEGKS